MKKETEDEPPKTISDPKNKVTYNRGKLLGKGGFAHVYEVTDISTNKLFADKIISKQIFSRRSSSREKIQREISLHKDLQHHHVVRFYGYFDDDRFVHMILENCGLKSLLHVMRFRKTLTEPEVRFYIRQICEGVRYIHRRGILHRDLKLGNMFLTHDMVIKIGDFGLATKIGDEKKSSSGNGSTLCGTPNYIAPEVLAKNGHNVAADIWAVGCMMYAMLFGTPPFETKSLNKTYAKIAANEYSIPPDSASVHAQAFIRKLLHPDPDQRGQLHQPAGHSQDLFAQPFFHYGFLPQSLPSSAVTTIPRFSVETMQRQRKQLQQQNQRESSSLTSCVPTLRNRITQIFNTPQPDPPRKTSSYSFVFRLREALCHCLKTSPKIGGSNDLYLSLEFIPIFVSKWMDYSNKYGFGYQMSDGSVGVLFNDATRMSVSGDKKLVEFCETPSKYVTIATDDVLDGRSDIRSRLNLVEYFARYMDENLADGSRNGTSGGARVTVTTGHKTAVVHIARWLRTSKTVVMELNNSSIQINFIEDHVKLVLWGENDEFYVTLFASDRKPATYSLESIALYGVSTNIWQRLGHVMNILDDLNQSDRSKENEQ